MRRNESENVELKKSTSELKAGVISLAAMLNKHQRGELWFGIKNDGTAAGQSILAATLRESLILQKNQDHLRWDTESCARATLEDISSSKLKSFLKACGLKYDTIPNALEKLGLTRDGKLLNAAVLCFARKPEKFLPNARLRCAVFGTLDTTVTISMNDYSGDVFNLIKTAEEYILAHINIGMRLNGLLRVDVPEIDPEAFREAIINAFCHRDYREYDSVNIAIFKDRVEVRNPGLLYGGLTVSDIRRKMLSERRNEQLANLKQEGVLCRIGTDKGGYWEVSED
jgi:ATP-dependent DNA helicase RecG